MSCAYRTAATRIATIAGIPPALMLTAMDTVRQRRVTFPALPPDRLRTIALRTSGGITCLCDAPCLFVSSWVTQLSGVIQSRRTGPANFGSVPPQMCRSKDVSAYSEQHGWGNQHDAHFVDAPAIAIAFAAGFEVSIPSYRCKERKSCHKHDRGCYAVSWRPSVT